MGTITITNTTGGVIRVSITTTFDPGEQGCFDIQPQGSGSWERINPQLASVFKEEIGHLETFVVKPGNNYLIS